MISVIMPVYNESKYVRRSIDSILNQSFRDFEFMIIDDGSTDNTLDIIKNVKDPRIIVFENSHQGIVAQLNYGISQARYKFIARMDGDDISEIDRFAKQYSFFRDNPEIDIVGSNIILIDEDGIPTIKKEYPEKHADIEFQMPILSALCHPSIMVKKSCLIKVGGYRDYSYSEDMDLFLRMLGQGFIFHNIQDYLLQYRFSRSFHNKKKLDVQKAMILKLGTDYLTKSFKEKPSPVYYYRLGLLNYYNGNLNKARNYLIKALIYSPKNILKISRFLVISLLGDKFIRFLRNKHILYKINLKIKKYFNIEFQKIYSAE